MIDRPLLLDWYAPRRAAFPWRERPEPYRVLVAEFMLQQTQVLRVLPAHAAFLRRFPTLRSLASAPAGDVIRAWAGLGYNRRAVALHRTARVVVDRFGGRIPVDPDELRSLPGIGPYSAAAIASQAFGFPAAAIDTNVRRVVSRALLGAEPGVAAPSAVREAASAWLDPGDPGAWNQALMDLGREICRPVPACDACPLRSACASPGPVPRPAVPRPGGQPFEGSFRQLRGRIVAALRAGGSGTVAGLAAALGEPEDRVRQAADALVRDGIAAAEGSRTGGDVPGSLSLPH